MEKIISKDLLIDVLGAELYLEHLWNIKGNELLYYTEENGGGKYINIDELARKCKDKAREWGYIVKSGFNEDIIEDDGSVALDCLDVDKYEVKVKKIVHNYKNTMQDKIVTVAIFCGKDLPQLDIKACEWIYKEIQK